MRFWLCAGAASGFLAVAMGAFAAHGLEDRLSPAAVGWVETGADYQMAHALALLAVAWLAGRPEAAAARLPAVAGWGFLAGSILFSGGLYVMALAGESALGLLVPVGGTAFLVGWAALFAHAIRDLAGSRGG